MRRLTVLLACMGLMVAIVAAAAYALTVQGTAANEEIREPVGCENGCDDLFRMRGGNDAVHANQDREPDQDIVRLGSGADFANTDEDSNDGQDVVRGGAGVDECIIDPTDTAISCQPE